MYNRSLGCGIVVKKEQDCRIRTSFQTLCDLYIDTDVVVDVFVTICTTLFIVVGLFDHVADEISCFRRRRWK